MSGEAEVRHPMDFDRDDFWHGVLCAWGCFLCLLLLESLIALAVTVVLSGGSMSDISMSIMIMLYVLFFGALGSALAALAFSPAAWLVARWMRRVRSIRIHVLVYASLGAVIGMVMTGIVGWWFFSASVHDALSSPWAWALIVPSAVSVAAGWGRAAWRAGLSAAPEPEASQSI